jgi:hypothetical protein
MKKAVFLFIAIAMIVCNGCEVVKDDDRSLEKDEVVLLKNVLLLDFADQECPYCPAASAEIAGLKKRYGETLVAVTIHASSKQLPLVTNDGNTYDSYFEIYKIGHPVGVIDGELSPEHEDWDGGIRARSQVAPSVDIGIAASYNVDSREVHIATQLKGLKKVSGTSLLLWVIEDNITDRQLLLNGSVNEQYLHQHIFRAAVNGTWGEEVSINVGEEKNLEHPYTLDTNWKPENISIVAFVYTPATNEVLEAKEIQLSQFSQWLKSLR